MSFPNDGIGSGKVPEVSIGGGNEGARNQEVLGQVLG